MKTKRKPKPSSLTLLDRKMDLEAYVLNHLVEVYDVDGSVTGYRLNLDTEQTEKLVKLIEAI